jgi:hypothetical protein
MSSRTSVARNLDGINVNVLCGCTGYSAVEIPQFPQAGTIGMTPHVFTIFKFANHHPILQIKDNNHYLHISRLAMRLRRGVGLVHCTFQDAAHLSPHHIPFHWNVFPEGANERSH